MGTPGRRDSRADGDLGADEESAREEAFLRAGVSTREATAIWSSRSMSRFDGADEVAGGEAGHRVEYVLELGTARPAVGRPDEAGVGLAEERQAVPLL